MTDWGTPGGATAPSWGGNVKVHVWMALATGTPLHWGPHPADRWTAGNVYASAIAGPDPATGGVYRLWVDLTCDTLDLTVALGATRADGVVARAEAGTVEIVLADPTRRLDPMNADGPWHTRLNPGVPVLVWAETLDGSTVTRHTLFSGAAESFREPWTPHPGARRATIVAVDSTTTLVDLQRPELETPLGAGDTVDQRLARVLAYHSAPVTLQAQPSTVTMAATTMDGSAWAQINEAADAEIGFAYVAAVGDPLAAETVTDLAVLRFITRDAWTSNEPVDFTVACPEVIAATVNALEATVRNDVTAHRPDGPDIHLRSQSSVDRFGVHNYTASDLPVSDDEEVGRWAEFILAAQAWPRATLGDVTMRPAATPALWPRLLDLDLADRVGIQWTPPGTSSIYDVTASVVGMRHAINRHRWEVTWTTLGTSQPLGTSLHWGPDADDRWSTGLTWALSPSSATVYLATEIGDLLADEDGNYLVAS